MSEQVISIDELRELYEADFDNGLLISKRVNRPVGGRCSTGGNSPYLRVTIERDGKRNQLYVHRVLMALHLGRWPSSVNHKDGDTLNNKLENLEEANQLTNMRNRSPNRNASIYGRGICSVERASGPSYWRLSISNNKKVSVWHFNKSKHSLLEVQLESVKRYHEIGYTDRHIMQTIKAIEANPEYQILRNSLAA